MLITNFVRKSLNLTTQLLTYPSCTKKMRPSHSYLSDEEYDDNIQKHTSDSEDELRTLSFGALNSARKQIERQTTKKSRSYSDSDSDGPPEETRTSTTTTRHSKSMKKSARTSTKRTSNNAPTVSSSKKPVSVVRDIPGLELQKPSSSLYRDIRFDTALGKANLHQIRKNYAFLDDYRQDEVQELDRILKDTKQRSKMNSRDIEQLERTRTQLASRLETLQTRDQLHKLLQQHKKQQMVNVAEGKQTNPYFLKKLEQRKLITKARFELLSANKRGKVMERKRKRQLGKEFKRLEFRNSKD